MSARSDAPGQCPFLSVSVRVSGHFERSSEIQDFEKRRAAAARQAAYRRRRRLGLIMVAFEVIEADLTAAGLARQLLGSAGATREELVRVGSVILQEGIKKE